MEQKTLKILTDEEKELVQKIVYEKKTFNGFSITEHLLKYGEYYKDIPVDIETFIDSPLYLGKSWINSDTGKTTVFPGWRKALKEIFPDQIHTNYKTLAQTGCLTSDTKIVTLNSEYETIGSLLNNWEGKYVLSYNIKNNSWEPDKILDIFSTGIKDVYEITLDNGEVIKATSNHRFLTRQNKWASIDNGLLKSGLSMMPYYYNITNDYVNVKDNKTEKYIRRYRIVGEWKTDIKKGFHIHHKNYIKFDDSPGNLCILDKKDHWMFHAKKGGDNWRRFNSDPIFAEKRRLRALKGIESFRNNFPEKYELHIKKFTDNGHTSESQRKSALKAWVKGLNYEKNAETVRKSLIAYNKSELGRNNSRLRAAHMRKLLDNKSDEEKKLISLKKGLASLKKLGIDSEKYKDRVSLIRMYEPDYDPLESAKDRFARKHSNNYNHKIVSIKYLGKEETFDITTEKNHNFALQAGIIAHNSIGIGKSKVACAIIAYMVYRDLCLKNPAAFYGLGDTDTIAYGLANINLANVTKVAQDYLQSMIETSDWLKDKGKLTQGLPNQILWTSESGNQRIVLGSLPRHFLGQNLRVVFVDEISFLPNLDIDKQVDKAKELIATIEARQDSRFIKQQAKYAQIVGGTPTFTVIASSKKNELSFMERYIEEKEKRNMGTTFIVDKKQWEMKPEEDYSGVKFKIAVGNKFLSSEIIPLDATEEEIQVYRNKGHQILDVPFEYYERFVENIDICLRDIAAISTLSSMKYLSGVKYAATINQELKNPFVREVIECGTNDKIPYSDYFDDTMIDQKTKSRPLFIHWDRSTTGDITGISGVCISGVLQREGSPEKEIHYRQVFSVGIKAPKGYEISYEKNRQFIYWLKSRGFNIKGISGDQFGGPESGQILKDKGFEYTYISVDRLSNEKLNEPYLMLKQAIYEGRIEMLPNLNRLQSEIIDIELRGNGKVDHPCFVGETKIALTDGRHLSILELLEEQEKGKQNYVYSMDLDLKRIRSKKIERVFKSGDATKLAKIILDNDEEIYCTLNHRFMTRTGEYVEAHLLKAEDSMMPLYTKYPSKGLLKNYRMYYEPFSNSWHYEHIQFSKKFYNKKEPPISNKIPHKDHKIKSIEFIDRNAEVFDLHIEGSPNFALSAGVFVHNSGSSKDILDSVCGALYNASKHGEEFAYTYGELLTGAFKGNNTNTITKEGQIDLTLDKKQLEVSFTDELKAAFANFAQEGPIKQEAPIHVKAETREQLESKRAMTDAQAREEREKRAIRSFANGLVLF